MTAAESRFQTRVRVCSWALTLGVLLLVLALLGMTRWPSKFAGLAMVAFVLLACAEVMARSVYIKAYAVVVLISGVVFVLSAFSVSLMAIVSGLSELGGARYDKALGPLVGGIGIPVATVLAAFGARRWAAWRLHDVVEPAEGLAGDQLALGLAVVIILLIVLGAAWFVSQPPSMWVPS